MAATGSRSRTAHGRAARTVCDMCGATPPEPSMPKGSPLGDIAEGGLVRGAIDAGRDDLGELGGRAVYAPAGNARGRRWLLPRRRHGDPLRARAVLLVSRDAGQRLDAEHAVRRRPRRRESDRRPSSPARTPRYGRRTASTRAAASRAGSTAAASFHATSALPQSASASRLTARVIRRPRRVSPAIPRATGGTRRRLARRATLPPRRPASSAARRPA